MVMSIGNASAVYYTPGTIGTPGDLDRYLNDEFNKIANAFAQIATGGGVNSSVTIPTGSVTLTGYENIVLVDGAYTITLPTAPGKIGRIINIIRTGSGTVTIDTQGSETISGDTFLNLTTQWDSVVVVSDGTNWVRCS